MIPTHFKSLFIWFFCKPRTAMSVSVKGLQVRLDEEGPLMFLSEWSMESDVTGYNAYKVEWIPEIGETLSTRREPEDMEDKYAVCVLKSNAIVGHLKKGQSGRYAKTVFYFLRSDPILSHENPCQ